MAPGPLTLFAPNDDAFAEVIKALKTTKLGLMELPNLGDILKNHVVAGAIMAADLKEGQARATAAPVASQHPASLRSTVAAFCAAFARAAAALRRAPRLRKLTSARARRS